MENLRSMDESLGKVKCKLPLCGPVTAYNADGAVSLFDSVVIFDGTGGGVLEFTLADGTTGQTIYFKAINVAGAMALTPASYRDGTYLVFEVDNDACILIFDGTYWNKFCVMQVKPK